MVNINNYYYLLGMGWFCCLRSHSKVGGGKF